MLPPVRTGAFVGGGCVAIGGAAVGSEEAVADATGTSEGGVVGTTVSVAGGGSTVGAGGGVTAGPGASVAG